MRCHDGRYYTMFKRNGFTLSYEPSPPHKNGRKLPPKRPYIRRGQPTHVRRRLQARRTVIILYSLPRNPKRGVRQTGEKKIRFHIWGRRRYVGALKRDDHLRLSLSEYCFTIIAGEFSTQTRRRPVVDRRRATRCAR